MLWSTLSALCVLVPFDVLTDQDIPQTTCYFHWVPRPIIKYVPHWDVSLFRPRSFIHYNHDRLNNSRLFSTYDLDSYPA
jgi:hypothetical protein